MTQSTETEAVYGPHFTKGTAAVLEKYAGRGKKEALARRILGPRSKRPISPGTLRNILHGWKPATAYVAQLREVTRIPAAWFSEPASPPAGAL